MADPPAALPPAPPATRESTAELARHHALTNARNAPRRQDRSYDNEWARYKRWVTLQRGLNNIPMDIKYITRANIDLYFQQEVTQRQIQPTGARRIVSALQKIANQVEYIDGRDSITVESASVLLALDVHQRYYMERMNQVDGRLDPHGNLPTNVLTEEELCRAHHVILETATLNWKDLSLSWSTCESTFMRWDSIRKLTLRDLRVNFTHCPQPQGGQGRKFSGMMTHILRKRIHKEKAATTRVAGAWRHKNVFRCCTGYLAMNLFVRLHSDRTLHFLRSNSPDPKVPPDWWGRRVICEWNDDNAAHEAYKVVIARASLKPTKVLHLRLQGIESASRGGLDNDECGTLSKHSTQKISRYATELYPPVLKNKSGFLNRQDEYYVGRTELMITDQMKATFNVVKCLFPLIEVWQEEQRSAHGDHTDAAYHFVQCLLPWIAHVIFQDGIYWIHHYPNHEVSRLLLHVFPPWYPEWAERARTWVTGMERSRKISQVSQLSQAAQSSYDVLYSDLQQVRQEQERSRQEQERSRQVQERFQDQVIHWIGRVDVQRAAEGVPPQEVPRRQGQVQPQARGPPPPGPPPPPVGLPPAPRNERLAVPYFPPALPCSMLELLNQHRDYKLESFANTSKAHWSPAVKLAYSKRRYLYKHIDLQAHRLRGDGDYFLDKLPRAAAMMDRLRNEKTLPEYLKVLKRADPTTKTRTRRRT
jgi:hypothetical protein